MRHFFFLLFTCLALLQMPSVANAQGLGSLLPSGSSDTSDDTNRIEEIMRQAAENGVGVVVINSNGEMVTEANTAGDTTAAGDGTKSGGDSSQLMKMQDSAVRFRSALLQRMRELPDAYNEVLFILRAASPDGTLWAFGKALIISLLLFAAGNVVEREVYGKRFAIHFVVARIREDPQGYSEKMPWLVFRFFMGVGGILVSMAVAYALGAIIFGPLEDTALQFTVTLINIGYFSCRFAAGLWRMILSPFMRQYRIPILSDSEAKRLHRWLWVLATFDICANLLGVWIGELGLNYDIYAFLSSLLSAVIVLMNIVMVLVNGRAISKAMRHGKSMEESTIVVRLLSRLWAPAVILYVIFAWFQLTYDLVLEVPISVPLIAGAYGILVSIIVVYGGINFIIERGFARANAIRRLNELRTEELAKEAEWREDHPDPTAAELISEDQIEAAYAAAEDEAFEAIPRRHALNSFQALARRVAGILAFVAGLYAFFYIWDEQSTQMVESLGDRVLDIMVIIFIGYILFHAFRIWIDTKIEEEVGDQEEGELGDEGGAASSASRLATLLPLFRNFVLILVVISILLIVLMELGINVSPLFAGAGIIGVAVGFGSQALVRDIFAGAFFLFDDAFRKGEYLDVGGVKGTVEKISVRSFQLRHHLGALHTIPFGELQVMTNYSRDWVIMKLPLRLTYDTDVERVRKLIKKLGVELLDDPVIGDNFIQPLKSQGVIEMQDSAMIVRVKFMTKPGDQWLVRKKVYEDIRTLFEREGIHFANREVTVRLADGKVDDLDEEGKKTVSAAAQAVIQEEEDLLEEPEQGGDDR